MEFIAQFWILIAFGILVLWAVWDEFTGPILRSFWWLIRWIFWLPVAPVVIPVQWYWRSSKRRKEARLKRRAEKKSQREIAKIEKEEVRRLAAETRQRELRQEQLRRELRESLKID